MISTNNRGRLKWNAKLLRELTPAKTSGDLRFDYCQSLSSFEGYYTRYGLGCVQDVFGIMDYCDNLRCVPILSQWCHNYTGDDNNEDREQKNSNNKFCVSFDLPDESSASGQLLQIGDKVKIYFTPLKLLDDGKMGDGENEDVENGEDVDNGENGEKGEGLDTDTP